jgi:glycosyltransferase involved in cell wall biosynthesis
MSTPAVSVIVDTYNHEKFIERAITSVLEQDFPAANVEVLVVDDGSTDRTPEILKKFNGKLRVIRKPNGGQASAFNAAVPETRAPIVAFLDGDDWWAKAKLSAVLDAFEKNPDVAAVGHGFYEVLDEAPPAEMFVPDKTCRLDLSSVASAQIADSGRTLLGTSRLAVRRSVLDRIGPIPAPLVFCADTPILTSALALGGAVVLDAPLCYYRIHGSSLFSVTALDPAKLRRKAETQAFLLEYLPKLLADFGVAPEIIAALLASDRTELERLKGWLGERTRTESWRTELGELRKASMTASPSYIAFKSLAAAAALALPPARYQRVREWYGRKNLKRFRDKLAPAASAAAPSLFQRRPVTRAD